uniref:Uncharacterized protein n=1 Tax=Siphoviridae sp. ctmIh35 TaxID=2827932 RepID=A0A8S5T8Z9_9CAUD|nr:MAG TPA: hypothetical protein [Siphoviridae sp. ctmIh35]
MNGYMPYMMNMDAMAAEQAALQQRIQQMEQQRQQYQPQPQSPAQNVNWIQVAGIEGAKNQIVQPGQTAWMMDNNSPVFYVKSVDGMGSATFKAFRFEEISPDCMAPQPQQTPPDYVTRAEFEDLLRKLGEPTLEKEDKTL